MGILDRVKAFLDSWPLIRENLEEVLKEDEGLFHSDRICGSLPGKPKNDLSPSMG